MFQVGRNAVTFVLDNDDPGGSDSAWRQDEGADSDGAGMYRGLTNEYSTHLK